MEFKDYSEAGKKYGVGGGEWMNLKEGDNKVRIISEFEDFGTHFDSKANRGVICIGEEVCKFCQKKEELMSEGASLKSKEVSQLLPKVQFLGWVIDRADEQIKLLRIGYQVFKQLGKFARSEEYSFEGIPPYDVNIQRIGTGLKTEYNVVPARKNSELTSTEEEAIEKIVKPPKDIIESMKAKVGQPELEAPPEEDEGEPPF